MATTLPVREARATRPVVLEWRPVSVALVAGSVFLLSSLRHLDAVPQVYEDEPWQASTAYKLMTQGVFGSDLFAGFHHMDQRYYGFMPLHPLLLAGVFRLLGPGLAQMRLESVLLTALTLALTFALGARLFGGWVAALAVALLVLVRWTGLTYVQLSGIPLIDFARIARYDPLVPVIGLSALHVYLWARDSPPRPWLYLAAGVLAGMAGLAHVYGLFWLPALLLLAVWDGRCPRQSAWIGVGSLLPWLPYAAYVLSDLPDWRGQTAIYASRFELLNPAWYLDNVVQEYHRYGPGLGAPGVGWLLRPGFWFLLLALPASLVALVRRASFTSDAHAARPIVVPALVFPVLFALFITLKLVNYTLIELPLFAIVVAWGVVSLWPRLGAPARAVALVVGAAMLLEGGASLVRVEQAASTTTPYPTFVSEIRAQLPTGARVLGLHSYWLGLEDFDYRSFLVPLNLADEGLPLDEALSQVAPDVVLLDARLRAYFDSPGVEADHDRFYGWLAAHAGRVIGRIDDPTYGLTEVFGVF